MCCAILRGAPVYSVRQLLHRHLGFGPPLSKSTHSHSVPTFFLKRARDTMGGGRADDRVARGGDRVLAKICGRYPLLQVNGGGRV